MSRIGKQKITIPQGVTVETKDGDIIVTGPKGTLTRALHACVTLTTTDGVIEVQVQNSADKLQKSLWGTFASHVKNMITGVTEGFKKELEINGVGYKVSMQGTDVKIEAGYSHPVIYKIPSEVTASTEKNRIMLESTDKERIGQIAAEIRLVRKPEPYKGKGIKYVDEVIRRKAGKTSSKGA